MCLYFLALPPLSNGIQGVNIIDLCVFRHYQYYFHIPPGYVYYKLRTADLHNETEPCVLKLEKKKLLNRKLSGKKCASGD